MPPRLIHDWVSQLTDPFVIKARAQKAMAKEPAKYEGIAVPGAVVVLEHLKAYIKGAQNSTSSDKRIRGNNKKWSLSLGESCGDLLNYLGFKTDVGGPFLSMI